MNNRFDIICAVQERAQIMSGGVVVFQSSQDSFLVTPLEGFELILPSNGVGSIMGLVFHWGMLPRLFF